MRAFKKSLAVIISFIIIILTLTVSGTMAYASNGHKITVKSTQNLFNDVSRIYKPGDTFDLVYYVRADHRLLNGTVALKYDKDVIGIASNEKDEDCVVLGSNFPKKHISSGNYSTKSDAYIFSYSAYTSDKSNFFTEAELIRFTFKISDKLSSDQIIDFEIRLLGAEETNPDTSGDKYIEYTYISSSTVNEEYASNFNVRVALTGGSEVKPDETTSETTAATKPSETEAQSQPSTAEASKSTESTEASKAATQPATSQQSQDIYGDANGDKIISIKDVTLIQKHIVRLTELSQDIQKKCDVNNDGQLNIKDATCIQWYLVKVSQRAGRTGNTCA